ncbi:MAG TPA: exodeoxyribonuclease V subunit beta [Methylobacter sp.]|jgi:exodeoxyribonuclease V beta subunit
MENNHFNPAQTDLLKGVNLIEASAGTGKTYTIAMLVLRFVVERGIAIEKLLVVTFTKAATEELKDRVRSRLVEARRALDGSVRQAQDRPTENIDSNIASWLANLDIAPELVRQRLNLALLDIDKAGIFTIHGFCQRVLKEHALESGQLFDAELTSDLADIKQACVDDFWRKQIYQRSAWEVAVLTANFKTPDALLASVAAFPGSRLGAYAELSVYPVCESLDAALRNLQQQADSAKKQLDKCAAALRNCFADEKFKASYTDNFEFYFTELNAWLDGKTSQIPASEAFALLTKSGLMDALNGNKFRTNKLQSGEERKIEYLAELAIDITAFDELAAVFKQIALVLRITLLVSLREDLDKRLQRLNVMSFDDLISRLADALHSEKGALLTSELQQRFEVALIDEFQDTDDSQWFIFSSVFAVPSQYLYLIGDPKQAIYKFRGADIHSYLSAQKQAEHQFTLDKNWRSHPGLVEAVNALFQRDRAFLLDGLEFINVTPGFSANNGALHYAGQAAALMVLWQLPESDSKAGYWRPDRKDAAEAIMIAVVNEVVELLTGDYTLQPADRALQPKDIAILVRKNAQAREYQAALRLAGVPSVLNSTESVFASQEAVDLYTLLQAVAHPGDSGLLKQALTVDWFDLDGQTLYRLINNEIELDGWISRFLGYFQDWQQTGLMAMMQRLLTQEKIRANISKTLMAERQLTNLYHLIELVQQAAVDEHLGINKTLDWLRSEMTKAGSAENQQLRLESDDDAVKIVTMHRSKGLEYSIVFCPYLWQRSNRLNSESLMIKCYEQGRTVIDLGSEDFERRRELALNEELAEDLRVFYVAVTRAKYRCYIAWADVRSENKPNDSAMAWLLEFADADFSGQQSKLQVFQDKAAYRLLDVPGELNGSYQKAIAQTNLQAKKRKRSLYTNWQMSSYTALSALSIHDEPELPEDKAGEQGGIAEPGSIAMELPRGAHTGNVVHNLLENIAFSYLSQRKDIATQRDKACQRYGLKLERPEILDELLQAVVATPLSEADADFCLMNLPENQCLKEMAFYLSMQTIDAAQINDILCDTPAFQPLTAKQMCGYLTGFIDLVCAFPSSATNRYYVMDYKTNSLQDYSTDSLTHAMREHNYGLQYWIYTVVLHRYLQTRLPDYDYETHFGGVRYLFVRGMQPDQPMSGVYQDRPDLERVEALAALFGGRP